MNSSIANRIQKNLKRLKPWAKKHGIEAYRIYDRDIPEYPFIVDRYGEYLVVYDRRQEIDFAEEKAHRYLEFKSALSQHNQPDKIIFKQRKRQRTENQSDQQYQKLSHTQKRLVIQEGSARFLVNLWDYLDTGLFLDHRLLRNQVFKAIQPGMKVLNLFSYTGSFSVFAALAGAKVTSVDMSNTYSQWAQDNFQENGLKPQEHHFLVKDVLQFLKDGSREKFDLVVLDPPTFSNSKKMSTSFEVEKDQLWLIERTMSFVKPNGQLFFSTNKRTFRLDGQLEDKYQVKNISKATLPFDFHDPKIHFAYCIRSKT